MEAHIVSVKYYSSKEFIKEIEVNELELKILIPNNALSSNIPLEKLIMQRLTGLAYNRKKIKILLIKEVIILVSLY